MSYIDKYNEWLNSAIIDDETKRELLALSEEEKELSFFKELEFGTAGLRGIMGSGTNRFNKYTVAKITDGLANFILKKKHANPSVVIAYDSRKNSAYFAEIAALVFNKKNIKTYLFKTLTPTPVLAYAALYLGTSSAINITSSHNAKEYNGYKLYNSEGYQYVSPDDIDIANEIKNIDYFQNIDLGEIPEMRARGLFNYVNDDVVESFISETRKLIKKRYDDDRSLRIVYTPLHGTGTKIMTAILNSVGFVNIYNVLEQRYPDGNFPTSPYPNPEDISTFEIAIEVAKKKDADIIIASDPDADRVGVMVKNKLGEYISLTGNQVGILIGSYVLQTADNLKNGIIIRSIVTGRMIDSMAAEYGVEIEEVYTGTKYIGEKIAEYHNSDEKRYIYGFEESVGYLLGTYARDKNAFSAALIICELCEVLKDHGITILEHLKELYNKYGYYLDKTISREYAGVDGMDKMSRIMCNLRENLPMQIDEYPIVKVEDFLSRKGCNSGEEFNIGLPPSNVLRFTFMDGSWFAIRPSGTEPKIKIYIQSFDLDEDIAANKLQVIEKGIMELI